MPHGITNHAVDARAAGQFMGSVEVLQGVQRDLARSSGFSNRRVGQRTAFPQGEDARWKSNFAHGHSDEV